MYNSNNKNQYKLKYDPIKYGKVKTTRTVKFDYNCAVYGLAIFDWVVL